MTPKELYVYQYGETEYIPHTFICYYSNGSRIQKGGIERDDPTSVQNIESLEFDHWLSKKTIDSFNKQFQDRMNQRSGDE